MKMDGAIKPFHAKTINNNEPPSDCFVQIDSFEDTDKTSARLGGPLFKKGSGLQALHSREKDNLA
jgi:hypothetical protein